MKHFLAIGTQVAWQQTSCSLETPLHPPARLSNSVKLRHNPGESAGTEGQRKGEGGGMQIIEP